jgi:hypothetical protein
MTTPPRHWRQYAALAALYAAATLLCRAWFMGDTVDYAVEALRFDRGGWEFGHLWWVPLGWAVRSLAGVEDIPGVVRIFLAVNWLAGLACVLLLRGLLARAGVAGRVASAVTVAFLFTHAFLNFALTGSSYVPGLACLHLAFYLALTGPERGVWPSLGAGLALGAAVCFWFPYVLAVPGVVLAPLVLRGEVSGGVDPRRPDRRDEPGGSPLWFAARLALAFRLLVGLAYGAAAVSLGITDVAGFRAWMARSAHGVTTRGAARMVFGLARSFISMGDDGVLFKRYLLKDPYNPVSLADLVRLSLWKFLLFYLALAAVGVNLLAGGARWRRLFLLALAGALPAVAFGVFWQGGDMERYLPLYPVFFLAFAGALSPGAGWRVTRRLAGAFFLVMVVVNALALAAPEVGRYRRRLADRLGDLPERLPPGSRLFVVRDRLHLLPRDFPLEPATGGLVIVEAVVPGLADTPNWRREFAEQAGRAWRDGGEVWLSNRLLNDRPRPDGTWVEGDDPRLKWADVPAYFRRFNTDADRGGDDGFVRLARSPGNRRLLGIKEER